MMIGWTWSPAQNTPLRRQHRFTEISPIPSLAEVKSAQSSKLQLVKRARMISEIQICSANPVLHALYGWGYPGTFSKYVWIKLQAREKGEREELGRFPIIDLRCSLSRKGTNRLWRTESLTSCHQDQIFLHLCIRCTKGRPASWHLFFFDQLCTRACSKPCPNGLQCSSSAAQCTHTHTMLSVGQEQHLK